MKTSTPVSAGSTIYDVAGQAGTRSQRRVGRIGVLTPVFCEAHCEMVIDTVESMEQLKEYLHSVSTFAGAIK